jgi:hypothetical protein
MQKQAATATAVDASGVYLLHAGPLKKALPAIYYNVWVWLDSSDQMSHMDHYKPKNL